MHVLVSDNGPDLEFFIVFCVIYHSSCDKVIMAACVTLCT